MTPSRAYQLKIWHNAKVSTIGETSKPRIEHAGAVHAGMISIGDHRVVSVTIDGAARPMSQLDAYTIANACELARAKSHPLVGFIKSTGANVREGIAAAHGWGTAAKSLISCSGIVPVVMIVTGPIVSSPSLMLGTADLVVMVRDSYAYVSGPTMVAQFTGLPIEREDLGGTGIHATESGIAACVVDTEAEAIELVSELLSYLPRSNSDLPPYRETSDPASRKCETLASIVPTDTGQSYDVRHVIEEIADHHIFNELRPRWASNLVTGFANIAGHSVGIVANQPNVLAGTLNIAASQKGARFVALCDAFNIPIITLVDTPGFQPGKDLEWRGMIRHGAQLAFAYARATVPRISVTLRKSYGGAYIVMDSKPMGNDVAMAWPCSEIAVMGAKGAVEILHRRSDPQDRPALEADYEQRLLNPYIAAERGSIDMVIDPSETRSQIASALDLLYSKREKLPRRRHDNTPL